MGFSHYYDIVIQFFNTLLQYDMNMVVSLYHGIKVPFYYCTLFELLAVFHFSLFVNEQHTTTMNDTVYSRNRCHNKSQLRFGVVERECVSSCHYKQQRGVKTFRHCCSAHVLATAKDPVVEMSEVESAQRHAAGLLRERGNVLIEGDEGRICVDLPSSKLSSKTILTCLLCWSLLSLTCQTFDQ